MAAAFKALNAKIRSNPVSDYLCSTHFWGPASNFGIPIAAVMDTQKDPEIISGPMTAALLGYSTIFMRYAFAVTPKNYLRCGCHAVNFSSQSVQAYRYVQHWHMGGHERALEANKRTGDEAGGALDKAAGLAGEKVGEGVRKVEEGVKKAVEGVKGR